MGFSMELQEAKQILKSGGYIVESFDDEIKNAFITQCGEMVIDNEYIWKTYYKRIMSNPNMVQYIEDAKADGLSPDEIVEYLLDWNESLNEDFGIGVGGLTGADQGIPHGGDCKAVVAFRMDGSKPKSRKWFIRKKKKRKASK